MSLIYNILDLKVHVIKDNKGKIRPRSWDIYSKLNVRKNSIVGITYCLLWLRKLAMTLEKEKRNLLEFIYENKGK